MAFLLSGILGHDIGIDLGTVNTLISRRGSGIILREPSAVAVNEKKEIVATGKDATTLLGRTPGSVQILHPLREGVIADVRLCEEMLRDFITRCFGKAIRRTSMRAVLCVPGCVTEVERRALEDAARGAGARAAFIMDEPMAAAIGAGLPVGEPVGTLVVDIGGGTTDAAVISLGGVVQKRSVRSGGTHIDEAIMQYMRVHHALNIGLPTAQMLKIKLASAIPGKSGCMEVRGRDLGTGLPRAQVVSAEQMYAAIRAPLKSILDCVRDVLLMTPPELAADIYERGLTLTGGGALLSGIAPLFSAEMGVRAHIAAHPLDCVAIGAQIAVENLSYYKARGA